jgi:beta-propeller repeat-containing protein
LIVSGFGVIFGRCCSVVRATLRADKPQTYDSLKALMPQYLRFSTTVFGAVLVTALGCGGSGSGGGGGSQDAGGDVDGPGPDAAVDATPIDMGPAACNLVWRDVQAGTDLDDQIWGLTADANQNIYAVGYEHGRTGPTNMTNLEPEGDARGVVIKFDPTGTVQWKTALDTTGADTAEGVTLEPGTGRLYVVGRTSGAFNGFTNQGQFDGFLATLEPTGQVINTFQSGDDRPAHPTHLNLGPNRSVLVAGYDDQFEEDRAVLAREVGFIASFERGQTPDAPYKQTYVQKAPFSMNLANRITGVAVDGDGSGSMYVTSSVTGGRLVGIHIKKLNSDGSEVWTHRISPVSADVVTVAMSPTNEVIVAGATSVTLGSTSYGAQDAFVLKMDKATGDVAWAAQAGSIDTDYPTSLAFDQAGNIYIAGETYGSVMQGGANQGGLDAFAMKFDPNGAWISSWQKGTDKDEVVTSVAADSCGNVLVGGYSKGVLTGASSAGGYDMFVLRASL